MGDYLGNLVAKLLDLGEVVQPRPVSLFEPPPVADWPASGDLLGVDAGDGQQAFGATAFDALSPTQLLTAYPPASSPSAFVQGPPAETWQQPPTRVSAREQVAETRLEPRFDLPGSAPAQPTSLPVLEPLPSPRAARPEVESLLPRSTRVQPGQPPVSTGDKRNEGTSPSRAQGQGPPEIEPVVRQIVVERTVLPATPSPGRGAGVEVETLPVPHTAERDRLIAAGPAVPPSESPPSLEVPAPVVARPLVRPAPRIEPVMPVPADSPPEPMPTIQVTIGRIEVRATSPPATAPKKQRPKSPVMSLDEYLRQRAGGDRQ